MVPPRHTNPRPKILSVVNYGDPILRKKAEPVTEITDEIRALAAQMAETMAAYRGIGLAANQVGVAIQLIVIDSSVLKGIVPNGSNDELNIDLYSPLVLINTTLSDVDETVKVKRVEGCLSIPGIKVEVSRPAEVEVKAQLLDGRTVEFTATDLLSACIQHEVEHSEGILITDVTNLFEKSRIKGKLKQLAALHKGKKPLK